MATYNQWHNIMEILKIMFKNPSLPLTMLQTHSIAWGKFCLFLNIVKRGKWVGTRNCPNSSFSHIFCLWFPVNVKNLSAVFYSWLFWITLKVSNYLLYHHDISLNNFWSRNKQLKYLVGEVKSLHSRFFSSKIKLLALQRRFHKTRHCTWDCTASGT